MKKRTEIYLLFILLLFYFGCGVKKNTYPDPSTEKTDGAVVSKTGTVKIDSTEYAADFGTITVSENRSKTTSRHIYLPFIRVHSLSKNRREPIFVFNGGPGSSNMRWNWGMMWYLLLDHDIVAVGYRGVDGSSLLDCPEVAEAYKGNGDLLSEESLNAIGLAWSVSAKRLSEQGVDLDGYTMQEVIEDNEAVRKRLGYERINLFSGSYGTRVAYLYGLKHPERITRSAMLCVNPPGRCVWEPEMIDKQLRRYSELWSRDSVMSLRTKNLYADMQSVLDNMPRSWFMVQIDPGKVKVVTFCLLFQRKTAAIAFDAFVAAKQGDPSGLALMSIAYNFIIPSISNWGDLASKAVSADFDSTRNYFLEMEPPNFPLGSPLSKLHWGPLRNGHWPIRQLPEEFRQLRNSNVETLMLSGSVDFANPAELATKELLPHLKNGKQIIFSECGHVGDVLDFDPEKTRQLITSFYRSGTVDTSKIEYHPMDFTVSWGLPALAKAGLGLTIFVATAVMALIVWLIKKYRRRNVKETISL